MAGERAKPAGLSGQEPRTEQGLKSLRHIKEFILRLNDEQWKALDENASSRCPRADFAAFCTKIEALVSNSGSPKCSPSLTGTFGKEAVLPADGETRRRWECEAGAPSTSSQRSPEGSAAICSIIGGMVKALQMPVQEANQSASYQMWTPVKGKTELRQETDAEVSSFPDDLRASPLVEARSARLTLLRRVKNRLVPFLCCFSHTSSLQSGSKPSWNVSVLTTLMFKWRDRKKAALGDHYHQPERRPEDRVSLYDCTVEVIETVVHLYKSEIKDVPQSQRVQKLTSDGFQVLCAHVVWDLLKARVELFLVQTPTTGTNAQAPGSVAPMIRLSVEGLKHLSDAAGDISKTLLEYLVTPKAALASVLSETVTSGEAKFYPDPDLYLTVQSNLTDVAAKLSRSEISSSPGLPEKTGDQVMEFTDEEEGHGDEEYYPGDVTGPYITPGWSDSALEMAFGRNRLLEDPMGMDRTHSEGSLEEMVWALMPFIVPRIRVRSYPSVDSPDLGTTDRKKSALSDRYQWPERGPEDRVSLYDCTVEVIETVVHLYKAEIKDAPQSQRVQKLTSDGFQVLCAHVVWDLLKARVELFLEQTPTTGTNAQAPGSVAPMIRLSVVGSKHLSDAAGDISKTLLEYLVTPDAALSSVLSEAITSGEAKFYPPLDLYLTVQSNLRDLVAKLNRSEISEISSSPGLPERNNDQVIEFAVRENGHGDGGKRPGNVTPFWSNSAQGTARGRNSLPEDPLDLDRTHVTGFVEDPGLGTSKELPSYPSGADSALVLETANEASYHRSTSPARPLPAAVKRRKRPTFRFGKKLNKVHPLENVSEEHQASSCGSSQQALHGESEASASSLKKLRKRLSRIFRVLIKA